MSDLERTRDHARRMAKHGGPDAELWTAIADEIDAYLAPAEDEPDLFGGMTGHDESPDDRTSP